MNYVIPVTGDQICGQAVHVLCGGRRSWYRRLRVAIAACIKSRLQLPSKFGRTTLTTVKCTGCMLPENYKLSGEKYINLLSPVIISAILLSTLIYLSGLSQPDLLRDNTALYAVLGI